MDGSDISLRDDRRPSDLHDPDELLWRQFGEAKSAEAFARTWLALQCRMIPGVTSGVLVLRSGGAADRFAPAAFWPEGRRTRPHLGEVAERALRERRALVVPVPQPHHEGAAAPPRLRYDVARPIEVDGELQGVEGDAGVAAAVLPVDAGIAAVNLPVDAGAPLTPEAPDSGAAALAAGLCPLASGSDAGGSAAFAAGSEMGLSVS